jgi:hypothetical protein
MVSEGDAGKASIRYASRVHYLSLGRQQPDAGPIWTGWVSRRCELQIEAAGELNGCCLLGWQLQIQCNRRQGVLLYYACELH